MNCWTIGTMMMKMITMVKVDDEVDDEEMDDDEEGNQAGG